MLTQLEMILHWHRGQCQLGMMMRMFETVLVLREMATTTSALELLSRVSKFKKLQQINFFLDNVILTAAHCLEEKCFDKDTFYVLAGVLDLRFGGGVTKKISETHTHPNYKVIESLHL